MKLSQMFMPTLKEVPSEAESPGHQRLIRAGLAHKSAAGIYTFLPMGKRVLEKVAKVIRRHMDPVANEILMPSVQPMSLWEESGRSEAYGPELLRINDRHERAFCYGPTHEEVVTDLMRHFVSGHRQLPVVLYQIQTKFRDEMRPRFGLIRAREFIMKDAYSFHLDKAGAHACYQAMRRAYCAILDELALDYRVVRADNGQIGGLLSEEFQILTPVGEDTLVLSDESDYAANLEAATSLPPEKTPRNPHKPSLFYTEISDVAGQVALLSSHFQEEGIPPSPLLKTLLVKGTKSPAVALVLRAEDEPSAAKIEKHPLVKTPLTLLEGSEMLALPSGFIGPVHADSPLGAPLPFHTIVDSAAHALGSVCVGANLPCQILRNGVFGESLRADEVFDLRVVKEGDFSPCGKGKLYFQKGIEVGHIFLLGDKYSRAMSFSVQGEGGERHHPLMGCYGIGVSRLVQALIEQREGVRFPSAVAPFSLVVAPLSVKSEAVMNAAESLYLQAKSAGIEVALDDRNLRVGEKLTDLELLGCPLVLTLGEKSLANQGVELRLAGEIKEIPLDSAIAIAQSHLSPKPPVK